MRKSLIKALSFKPPKGIHRFLEDAHLAGDETAEEYIDLFSAIADETNPSSSLDWLDTKDIVDLTWDIRRERRIKAGIVELMQKEIILGQLKATHGDPASVETHEYRIFEADNEANRWGSDSTARKEINEKLAARGVLPTEILTKAYMKGSSHIDAVDRRIANYEARRRVTLREIEHRSERLSRLLGKASAQVLDAEFVEAAE